MTAITLSVDEQAALTVVSEGVQPPAILVPGVRCTVLARTPARERLLKLLLKITGTAEDGSGRLRCKASNGEYIDCYGVDYKVRSTLQEALITGEIEIDPAAIVGWAPPRSDEDEMRAFLKARSPRLTDEIIDRLADIAECVPGDLHGDTGLATLIDADMPSAGENGPGEFSFQLNQVERDWQFSASVIERLLPEGTSFETVLDRTYEDGEDRYRVSIATCEDLLIRAVNWLGDYTDDDTDASVRVDLVFGTSEERAQYLADWKREEVRQIADDLKALCDSLSAELLEEVRAEVGARFETLLAKAA